MKYNYISDDVKEKIIEIAHALHRNPELSHREFLSTGRLAEIMKNLDIELTRAQPKTGIVGILRGKTPGPTVVLRADIDALPIDETREHEVRSENENVMHACGHDFHTASLVGAMTALSKRRDALSGNVIFLFQPAEEKCSGAEEVLSTGVFDEYRPDAFFSLHVKPDIPLGKIGIRKGPIMAAMCSFRVRVLGKGGHGATPHLATDPIIAAAEIVGSLQSIRSRWADPSQPFTLSVCSIHGGSACNIIPDDVCLEGTFRYALDSYREGVKEQILRITETVAKAHGCSAECSFFKEAPPLVNDERLAEIAKESASALYGEESIIAQNFWMASEDFSFYREKAPVFMYHVGVGKEDGSSPSLHNPCFFAPDETAPFCAELLTETTLTALKKL